jgi:hypothetical protein
MTPAKPTVSYITTSEVTGLYGPSHYFQIALNICAWRTW